MPEHGTALLMYHELALPGRPLCHHEPGYTRYVVSASTFRNQIEQLKTVGFIGRSVSDALRAFDGKTVGITFDDGCETDLLAAAPLLQESGFDATFFLTVDFVGKPGYLSPAQVRSLIALGFEVGCHSRTHPYLTDIDDSRLREETAGAKDRLQQIAGIAIRHFSCPGGRWDQRVRDAVRAAQFETMATSRTAMNHARTDPFSLPRIAVLEGTSPEALLHICHGRGLLRTQLLEKARDLAKRLLGNSAYDSLRGFFLGHDQDSKLHPH